MSRLKIKKGIIYLEILVFSLIGGFAIIQSCAKETGTGGEGGKTVTDISSLPPNEQSEVLQIQDSSLGEVGLISDTELNPAIIEISLQEIDSILTARAPISLKDEFSDEEKKTKQEMDQELSIKEIIRNFVSDLYQMKLFRNLRRLKTSSNMLID